MTTILRENRGSIAILTLNRPDKLNAANLELQETIAAELAAVARDREVRALVLTGAGRAFSAGGDRSILQGIAEGTLPADTHQRVSRANSATIRTMLELEIPAFAAVNGFAIGYGSGLIALCDMVVMGASAYLSDPHVQFGIAATPSAQLIWPNQCSEIVAREILMSGRRVGAEEALRIGLCNRICADGAELDAALEMAEALVALPRAGITETKRSFNTPLLADAVRRGYVES